MLPADEATWLKQLAEAERSRRAARSTLTASLSTDELLAARPPQPQALPLGHTAGVEAGVQSRHPSIVVTPAQSQQAVSWPPPPPPIRSTNVPFGGTWPPPPPPVTAVRPEGFALSSSAVSSTLSAAAAVYAAGGGFTGAGASGAAGSCTLVVRRPQIVGQALEPDDPALAAAPTIEAAALAREALVRMAAGAQPRTSAAKFSASRGSTPACAASAAAGAASIPGAPALASAAAVASGAASGSLLKMTELIKSKLNLSGTMPAVATDAAMHLGLDPAGKDTATLINECHRALQAESEGVAAAAEGTRPASASVLSSTRPPPPERPSRLEGEGARGADSHRTLFAAAAVAEAERARRELRKAEPVLSAFGNSASLTRPRQWRPAHIDRRRPESASSTSPPKRRRPSPTATADAALQVIERDEDKQPSYTAFGATLQPHPVRAPPPRQPLSSRENRDDRSRPWRDGRLPSKPQVLVPPVRIPTPVMGVNVHTIVGPTFGAPATTPKPRPPPLPKAELTSQEREEAAAFMLQKRARDARAARTAKALKEAEKLQRQRLLESLEKRHREEILQRVEESREASAEAEGRRLAERYELEARRQRAQEDQEAEERAAREVEGEAERAASEARRKRRAAKAARQLLLRMIAPGGATPPFVREAARPPPNAAAVAAAAAAAAGSHFEGRLRGAAAAAESLAPHTRR